jgi:hypothetical protein
MWRRRHKAAGRPQTTKAVLSNAAPDGPAATCSISADYANYRAHSARPAAVASGHGNASATRVGGRCLAIPPSFAPEGGATGAMPSHIVPSEPVIDRSATEIKDEDRGKIQ